MSRKDEIAGLSWGEINEVHRESVPHLRRVLTDSIMYIGLLVVEGHADETLESTLGQLSAALFSMKEIELLVERLAAIANGKVDDIDTSDNERAEAAQAKNSLERREGVVS